MKTLGQTSCAYLLNKQLFRQHPSACLNRHHFERAQSYLGLHMSWWKYPAGLSQTPSATITGYLWYSQYKTALFQKQQDRLWRFSREDTGIERWKGQSGGVRVVQLRSEVSFKHLGRKKTVQFSLAFFCCLQAQLTPNLRITREAYHSHPVPPSRAQAYADGLAFDTGDRGRHFKHGVRKRQECALGWDRSLWNQ